MYINIHINTVYIIYIRVCPKLGYTGYTTTPLHMINHGIEGGGLFETNPYTVTLYYYIMIHICMITHTCKEHNDMYMGFPEMGFPPSSHPFLGFSLNHLLAVGTPHGDPMLFKVNIFDIDTENRRAVQEFLTSDYDARSKPSVRVNPVCCGCKYMWESLYIYIHIYIYLYTHMFEDTDGFVYSCVELSLSIGYCNVLVSSGIYPSF